MKFPFFKSLLVAGALLLAWNCSDNTTMSPINGLPALSEEARVLSTPDGYLYITEDGRVINGQGVEVAQVGENGTFTYGDNEYQFNPDELEKVELVKTDDGQTVVITEDNQVKDTEGNVIGQKNDDGTITNENGDVIADLNGGSDNSDSGEGGENGEGGNNGGSGNGEGHQTSHSSTSNGNNNNPSGNSSTSNGNNNNPSGNSSTSNGNNNTTTSTASGNDCEGKCYDSISGKCVNYYAQGLKGPNDEQYSYNESCVLQCWHDPTQKACANLGISSNPNPNPNPNPTPKSSSSSKQQQQQPSSTSQHSGSAQLPKVINGNEQTGYATRYWDSCKPHCAWSGKGGPVARTCKTDGVSRAGVDEASVCDGGNAGTCFDQTPQIVNDTIAYAFAATPGGGNDCGKCYMLTFTGNGSSSKGSSTPSANSKIRGKHLIVMASNVGYDVAGGQFDLMIPGGGPGKYNGCGKMGISCAGAQYGGFLTTCNFDKTCLINKCKQEYSNTSLQNGCLFLANWMEGADNPEVKYVQVECPSALSAKY